MTKQISIKNVVIGGGSPIAVQSMTNTRTANIAATISQIQALAEAGCDIVRLAVEDFSDAEAVEAIKKSVDLPLVADIHFDHRLALAAIKAGADKIRINPGNIGSAEKLKEIALAAKERDLPIRIGVNSGSVEKDILKKYGTSAEGLVKSALRHIEFFEDFGFCSLVISVKSSDVAVMTRAYRYLSSLTEYPLHLGVTEAGVGQRGLVKSAVGIGYLLLDGIGDTIRVSLSGNPVKEVEAARLIIEASGRTKNFVEVVACPTCGRTEVDIEGLATEIERAVKGRVVTKKIKIAVMGCVVNGPGEAADADIGVAGGRQKSMIFSGGKVLKTVENGQILSEILALLEGIE